MSRFTAFAFTWNNYPEGASASLQALAFKYLVFGYEQGESGTPHLQGTIVFPNQLSIKSVIKKMPGCHISVCRDVEASITYCKKDGAFEEFGTLPLSRSSAASNAREKRKIKNDLLLSLPLADLVSSGELSLHEVPIIKKAKLILAAELSPYTHDDVRGLWFVGPAGTGKSRYAFETYPDAYRKAQNKWFDGYEGQDTIILDDLDSSMLGHYLKIWSDRYPCTGEVKCGTVQLRHKRFIVTSNFKIEGLFAEHPKMVEPLLRRFKVTHFGPYDFNPLYE